MPAFVTRDDGATRPVRNLGWLLRHASEATSVHVHPRIDASHDCVLYVHGNTWVFESTFQSRAVLSAWLDRPRFRGLPLAWFGRPVTVGDAAHRGIILDAFRPRAAA